MQFIDCNDGNGLIPGYTDAHAETVANDAELLYDVASTLRMRNRLQSLEIMTFYFIIHAVRQKRIDEEDSRARPVAGCTDPPCPCLRL